MRVLTEAELSALPVEVIEAVRTYSEARRDVEARRVYIESRRVYIEARRVYIEAWRVYIEVFRKHASALDTWHRAVCTTECKATEGNKWNIFG